MSHQALPKSTGVVTDGYVLTYIASDGYWAPRKVSGGWTTIYDVDFRTATPQTISTDGNYVVAGKTWTMANRASADSVVIDSSGLTIDCNATNTDYANAVNTAANFSVKFTDVIPNYDPLKHAVRVWVYISALNADQDFELAFLSLDRTGGSPVNKMLHMYKKGFINGLGGNVHYANGTINNGTQGDIQTTANYSDDVLIIQLPFAGASQFECISGLYNTGTNSWPAITDLRHRWRYLMNYGTPGTVWNIRDVDFPFKAVLGAQTVNTTNTLVVTFARFKIEYQDVGQASGTSIQNTAASDISWLSTKTSNFVAGTTDSYIPVDTTGGVVTITLPPSPNNGERHIIADVGGNAATNNITVNGNGHNIIGSSSYIITGPYNVLEVAYNTDKTIWVII